MNLPANPSPSLVARNPHIYRSKQPNSSELPKSSEPKRKRVRQDSKPLLNKLEEECLAELLRPEFQNLVYSQAIRFRLGNGIWYRPDFVVMKRAWTGELLAYEVKGPHAFRGGLENLKVAAGLYPDITWVLVWKEDGAWRTQRILP